MNEKVFLRAIYLLLFWSFWGFNLEYLAAARCAWASTSSNGTWRFFHIFDTNIPSLFMEELQQLNLATELPGQKIHVIVSLFSVPKMIFAVIWRSLLAEKLRGSRNAPVMKGYFRWGMPLPAALQSSLGRRGPKGPKSLKAAEQFLTVTPSPGCCYCCRGVSGE